METIPSKPTPGAEAYYAFAMAKMAQKQQRYDAAITFLKEAAQSDPKSAAIQAELGATYLIVRDYPAAEEAARAALKLDPKSSRAHQMLAQLFYSRARRGIEPVKNRERAMAELEASLTGGPEDDLDALLTLSRFYLEAGNYEKAAILLQQFLDHHPSPPMGPLFLLARSLVQLERYEEAGAVLERILEGAPDSLQALEMLVNIKRLQQDFRGTVDPLKRIMAIRGGDAMTYKQLGDAYYRTGEFVDAIRMFKMAGREEPGSPYSLYYLALSQEQLGLTDQARDTLGRMLARDPGNAEILFRLARLEEKAGALEEAIPHYRQLVRSLRQLDDKDDPRRGDIPVFCARLGVLQVEREHYDQAIKDLGSCKDKAGDTPLLDLLLVRALVFAGKEDRALAEVKRAARAHPDDPRFPVLKAEVLLAMGRDQQGEDQLMSLLEEARSTEAREDASGGDQDDSSGGGQEDASGGGPAGEKVQEIPMAQLVSDAFFNAGALAERREMTGRAEKFLHKAIELNPDNAAALNYLGYIWADGNRNLDESLKLLNRAVRLDPENGAYLDSLGWVYYRLGRTREALDHLLKAVAVLPTDATVHDHLGDVEAAAGHNHQAEKSWQKALDLSPDRPEEIRLKLEQMRERADGP